ncbi:MAG: hypothetical protein K2X00_08510 [Nitrospiraceae bacterium]|nr:hypothetical protein [Nitrospiraceae bacterium]OQW65701.1 MAG: hypothetical protein BVN29_08745 [Nitrospira sp. ST-bin5]
MLRTSTAPAVVLLFAGLLSVLITAAAESAPVTFNYAGSVNSYIGDQLVLDTVFPLGTPIQLSYTFEPATPSDPALSTPTSPFYGGAISSATVSLGEFTWHLAATSLYLSNGISVEANRYFATFPISGQSPNPSQFSVDSFLFQAGYGANVFESLAIPLTPPSPTDPFAAFAFSPGLVVFSKVGGGGGVVGTTLAPVPLPAAMPLFSTGLGLALLAWRRSRHFSTRLVGPTRS